MKDNVYFMLGALSQEEDLRKLQQWLEGTGIEADIKTRNMGTQTVSFLQITCDDAVRRVKRTRNAGRPYMGHHGRYTCGDIRKMQQSMSNKEIADILCLSERSLYRRLKENASSSDNDEFI